MTTRNVHLAEEENRKEENQLTYRLLQQTIHSMQMTHPTSSSILVYPLSSQPNARDKHSKMLSTNCMDAPKNWLMMVCSKLLYA